MFFFPLPPAAASRTGCCAGFPAGRASGLSPLGGGTPGTAPECRALHHFAACERRGTSCPPSPSSKVRASLGPPLRAPLCPLRAPEAQPGPLAQSKIGN